LVRLRLVELLESAEAESAAVVSAGRGILAGARSGELSSEATGDLLSKAFGAIGDGGEVGGVASLTLTVETREGDKYTVQLTPIDGSEVVLAAIARHAMGAVARACTCHCASDLRRYFGL
jgi:hypothetical protein